MQIKELIFDAKEPMVYCESFVYEPSNVEEEKLGHLFMIGRIRNVPESSFYLINLLASRIKREYYSVYHRSIAAAIEAALKEGNRILKENEERINWLGNLDFLVAAVSKKRIYFTLLGKMGAFILRGEEVIDLVKNLILERDVLFPFSTILQGAIKRDDILIFSTSNIFSKDKLLKLGKELFPIEERRIKRLIDSSESGTALVVETEKEAKAIEKITSKKERARFLQKIPAILLPQGKEILEKFNSFILKNSKIFLKKLKESLLAIPEFFKKPLSGKKEVPIPSINLEKASFPKKQKFALKGFKRETPKTWIILILIFILILAGLGTYQYKKNVEIRLLTEKIEMAKAKREEGENALIYADKEKSLAYFSESLDILNSIENPGDKKEEIENLKKEIEGKISKISGRKILSKIKPLFEIKEGIEKFTPEGILFSKNNIYIFSSSSSLVYKWDILKKEGYFIEQREKVLGGTVLGGEPFFLLSPTSVTITEKEKILPLDFPYEELSIGELDNFLNYFYIFDKEKGEIIKYTLEEDKISSPILWFKEREAGKGAVSIAIDGSIYLVLPDGKIKKFSVGALKEEILPSKTYPEIKGITKIFTSKDNKYLYLIEPSEKRVIILDKKGKIICEYQSNQFEDLKDIWVTAGDKKIYLLCGREIFEIKME